VVSWWLFEAIIRGRVWGPEKEWPSRVGAKKGCRNADCNAEKGQGWTGINGMVKAMIEMEGSLSPPWLESRALPQSEER